MFSCAAVDPAAKMPTMTPVMATTPAITVALFARYLTKCMSCLCSRGARAHVIVHATKFKAAEGAVMSAVRLWRIGCAAATAWVCGLAHDPLPLYRNTARNFRAAAGLAGGIDAEIRREVRMRS
jgi:hypothetical protein